MKYKLLEKIPGIDWEVGEVEETESIGVISPKGMYNIYPPVLFVLQKLGVIEEVKELKPFSVDNPPEVGEKYFYNIPYGNSYNWNYEYWDKEKIHIYRLKTNNCFRALEEAEEAYKKIMGE